MANGDPVTHAELSKIINGQTDRIESKLDRQYDRLSADIKEVKSGCEDDVKEVGERVTYLERKSQRDNIIGSAIAFVGAALIAWFKGGP